MSEEGIHPFIRHLWEMRNGFPNTSIIALNSMFKKFVRRAVEEGQDPTLIEDHLYDVDRLLPFDQIVSYIEEKTGISYESPEGEMADYAFSELDKSAAELDARLLKEKDYEKLLGWEQKARREIEKRKEMAGDLEKLRSEKEEIKKETERKLAEMARRVEAAERVQLKMVTVKFLKDVPKFIGSDLKPYGPYKTEDIATLPEGNAAAFIEKGIAKAWTTPIPTVAPTPPPRPPTKEKKGLTSDETRLLRAKLNVALIDELGRVPPNTSSVFIVELEKVKDKSYEEALAHMMDVAKEVVSREIARAKPARPPRERRIEPYRPPVEREEEFYVAGRAPPAYPPSAPIDEELPWPRHPSSAEELELWKAFRYRLQEIGMNAFDYRKLWEEYIYNVNHKDWKQLLERYEKFVEALVKGEKLTPLWLWKGVPIPYGLEGLLSKEPFRRTIDLIVWATSIEISNARFENRKPSVAEVITNLEERDVPVSYEDVKEALLKAYKEKDQVEKYRIWFTNITLEDLEEFIASKALPE